MASSARAGGSISIAPGSPSAPFSSRGRWRSAVTNRAAKSRHQTKTGGKFSPISPAPSCQSPSPLPWLNAVHSRAAALASRSGASSLFSKTSLPRGASCNAARIRPACATPPRARAFARGLGNAAMRLFQSWASLKRFGLSANRRIIGCCPVRHKAGRGASHRTFTARCLSGGASAAGKRAVLKCKDHRRGPPLPVNTCRTTPM